jgi:hypothetical protein
MAWPAFILNKIGKLKDDYIRLNTYFATIKSIWDAHIAGTADKHLAAHIEYTPNGNSMKTQYDNHVAGSADKHAAEDITLDSERPTLTAEDVKAGLEQIDQRIDGIVNNPDPNKDLELVDFRTSAEYGVFATAKERGDNTDNLLASHLADNMQITLNAKTEGAIGDGIADDTAALQAALDSLIDGGVLTIPAGTYIISSPLTIPRNGIIVRGAGRSTTIIKLTTDHTDFAFIIPNNTYYAVIENLEINGNGSNTALGGIHLINSNECSIRNVKVTNFENESAIGFYQSVRGWNNTFENCRCQLSIDSAAGPKGYAGFSIAGGNYTNIEFRNCFSHLCNRGFIIENQSPASDTISFINCTANNAPAASRTNTGIAGFVIGSGVIDWEISNAHVEWWNDEGEVGILINANSANGEIRKCGFYSCLTAISGDATDLLFIKGNKYDGDAAGYQAHNIINSTKIYINDNKVYSAKITIADEFTNSNVYRLGTNLALLDTINTFTKDIKISKTNPAIFLKDAGSTDKDVRILLENGVLKIQKINDDETYAGTSVSIDMSDLNFGVGSNGAWNTAHLKIGTYHLWVDSTGDLRIKNGAPTSDTDGAVVGAQS